MATILLVSSTGAEFAGLTRHFAPKDLGWPLDYAREIVRRDGRNAGERWLLVANGAGTQLAGEAFQVAREHATIDAVVSTGYCGALDPALKPASVIVATNVCSGGTNYPAAQLEGPGSARRVPVAGADRVVQSANEKLALRNETGADAVDMESHGLARAASDAGIPFHCVRAVTDSAIEDMHFDFNAARDASGRIRGARVLQLALCRPFATLPELCKLAYRGWRAGINLGDFLAACRF